MTTSLFVSSGYRKPLRKIAAGFLMLSINLTGGVGALFLSTEVAYARQPVTVRSFSAVITPTTVNVGTVQAYTVTITNSNTSTEDIQSASIARPSGWTPITSIVLGGAASSPAPYSVIYDSTSGSDGRINFSKTTGPGGITPGQSFTISFNVTSPIIPGTGVFVVRAFGNNSFSNTSGQEFTQTGSEPQVVATSPVQYLLSVSKTGSTGLGTVTSVPAGINCGADCTESYAQDALVTLTASAASGSNFTGWTGVSGCSGMSCTVTMDMAKTVTATFLLSPVLGCMNPEATNYNPIATQDNGSCTLPVLGCTNPEALNYNSSATQGNANATSCTYPVLGCTDATATNYNSAATQGNANATSCTYSVPGCMNPVALNYSASATVDNGSCEFSTDPVPGCMNPEAINYNPNATEDDDSCTLPVLGCTNPEALNYNSAATQGNVNATSCTYPVLGCTDVTATNYNSAATAGNANATSCTYDRCSNLDGAQTEAPFGYEQNQDGTCQVACRADFNLIQNGGFEAPALSYGAWTIETNQTVSKWFSALVSNSESAPGVEIQDHAAGTPAEGENLAELDGNAPTRIWQNIPTIAGKEYTLSFKYSPRPGTDAADNTIQVRKDDVALGADLSRGSTSGDTEWSSESRTFSGTGATVKIEFADLGTATSLGSYLDDVSLTCRTPVVVRQCTESQTLVGDECVDNTPPSGGGGGGSSTFDYWGCTNPSATNFNSLANKDDGQCQLPGGGGTPQATSTPGEVLGAATTEPELPLPASCSAHITTYMKLGRKANNVEDVKRLQTFLNETMSANLPVSGHFGSLTKKWVKKFQVANSETIIKPWIDAGHSIKELKEGTGVVYKTTKHAINLMKCTSLVEPMPSLVADQGLQ